MKMTSLILRHSDIVYLNNVKERNLAEMTKSWAIIEKNLLISFWKCDNSRSEVELFPVHLGNTNCWSMELHWPRATAITRSSRIGRSLVKNWEVTRENALFGLAWLLNIVEALKTKVWNNVVFVGAHFELVLYVLSFVLFSVYQLACCL